MCGHMCKCFCHKNSGILCIRCNCQKCYVCDDHVSAESFEHHLNFCHHMAQAHVLRLKRRPPLVDLVAVAG